MKAFSIFLLLLCCSCSNKETKVNQTIKLPSSIDPISFDPRIAGDSNSQATLRLVYEGLTRIEPDGKPHLAVASNVEISEDKKVYTFKDKYMEDLTMDEREALEELINLKGSLSEDNKYWGY